MPEMPPPTMFWFIPVSGDGPYLGSSQGRRAADHGYLREIAVAIDRLGFKGALIPTGQDCEDSWITASALATVTRQMKFLVALRPAVTSPTFAARQAIALDRVSEGRLLLNVVCGSSPVELAADGVYLAHDDRYGQGAEFLTIWRRLMQGETVDYAGRYFNIQKARLSFQPVQKPYPPLWLGGSSEPAKNLAGEQIDLYLTYGETVPQVAEKIASVRERAAKKGRKIRFGLRLHFIVRETDEEAWAAADKLISRVSDDAIAAARDRFMKDHDSVGQRRMIDLHNYDRNRLEIAPNLWAGVGLVRVGAATALVGSPKVVAERLREYQAVGIDTIIGSGYPHLEEAYRVAELLFPALGLGEASGHQHERSANEFDPALALLSTAAG